MSDHMLRLSRVVAEVTTRTHPTSSLESHAWQLVRDLEAAPATERRTITREEWTAFLAALDHYAGHFGDRSGAEDEALALAMLKSPLRLTVED